MNNHKLIDTGEYLVSEVDGRPTCLYSYDFYDKLVDHPKVKEYYDEMSDYYEIKPKEFLTDFDNTPRIEPSNKLGKPSHLVMKLIGRI